MASNISAPIFLLYLYTMQNRYLSLVFALFFCQIAFAQYNNPYRIAQDGTNYFVTNKGNGTVIKIDSSFSTSTVISGLYSPNDIFSGSIGPNSAIVIIDSNQIKLYDKTTYGSLINLNITGAVEAHDGVFNPNNSNEFFISDRAGDKIIKGSIGSAPFYPITYSTLISGIDRPAGMIFDDRDRLLVVTDTTDAEIHWIDISTGSDSILLSTNLDYLNDLSQDGEGNFYVTCWGDNYMYRFDSTFNDQYRLAGYSNPAGMLPNIADDYMVLACHNCNKVEFEAFHVFSPFDDITTCINDSFIAGFNPVYQGIGTYNSDNKFILEVSDSNGNFSAPTMVAQVSQDTVPELILSKLPQGVYASTGHKYRYRSTSPADLSFGTKDLILYQLPDAFINQSDTLAICTGSSIILGQGAQNDVIYDWSPGTYVSDSASSNPSYTRTSIGSYDLMLLSTDTITGCSNSSSIHINVGPNLSISQLADSLEICPGDSIEVGVDGLPYFFSWSGSDSLSNIGIGNPTFFDIESKMLQVIFSDFTLTCTGSDSVFVQVNTPDPLIGSNMLVDSNCLGDTSFVILPFDQHYTYSWNSSGILTSSDQYAPSFLFASSGVKTIYANYQHKTTLCQAEDSLFLKVLDLPIIFQSIYRDTVCQGSARELQLTMDPALSYSWSSRGGSVLNSDSIVPSFLVQAEVLTDTIDVQGTSLSNGCSSEGQMYLDVLLNKEGTVLETDAINISLNDSYLEDQLAQNNALLKISWEVNENAFTGTLDKDSLFPRELITHGDSVRAIFHWVLGEDTLCSFRSAYFEKVNLGSVQELSSRIKVYPNPLQVGSILQIDAQGPRVDQVTVFNSYGAEIDAKYENHSIILPETPGVYTLLLQSDGVLYSTRVLVQ